MKKLLTVSALLLALIAPAAAQRYKLSLSDQKRFDSYYSRWQAYRATNNSGEIVSMEKRMQDVYSHYGIPPNTPYGNVSSSGHGTWVNNNQNQSPTWSPNHDPNHDWARDHDRDRDWQRHREWEERREREHEAAWHRDHPDSDREHHDNGLHRGWYKNRHNPHNPDYDHDRHDREHHDHDRDHDKDHDKDHDHH
jgi:hypothetical protein